MSDTMIHVPQYPDAAIFIIPANPASPAGKLADVEIHFHTGILTGLRLTGFALWEKRSADGRRNVTFPARTYSVNGARRSFALLRPQQNAPDHGTGWQDGQHAQDRLIAAIVDAYAATEQPARTARRGAVLDRIINADTAAGEAFLDREWNRLTR
jgi:hypothetical protein